MEFSGKVILWQKKYGRHDLPWQKTRDPYKIWVSEIMLQQTQVNTVIPYYHRFLKRFPTIRALASAKQESVLSLWSGLGYYSRARNLHKAARILKNRFPAAFDDILSLPGIGQSTAGAISVFAFNERKPILDGNVKRVFMRYFGEESWELAERLLPKKDIVSYTQGLMDLGAMICTRNNPACGECPLDEDCRKLEIKSKSRKPRKLKKAAMLVIRKAGKVLLVKRPQMGIWGGLYVLPEVPLNRCRGRLDRLPSFTHSFTHFDYEIHPVIVETKAPAVKGRWMTKAQALKAAIPVPVRKILEGEAL